MAPKKNAFAQPDLSVDAAVTADLGPIANHSVVAQVTQGANRNMAADDHIASDRGKWTGNYAYSESYIRSDVGKGMNHIHKFASLSEYGRVAFHLHSGIADGANEDVTRRNTISLNVA
jgi:hypothetical protein